MFGELFEQPAEPQPLLLEYHPLSQPTERPAQPGSDSGHAGSRWNRAGFGATVPWHLQKRAAGLFTGLRNQ
jgi:hypothetical protein